MKLSMQKKMFLTCISLTLGALMIVALLYNTITTSINRQTAVQSSRRELSLITASVDGILSHITDYAISISVDSRVTNLLQANPTLPDSEADRFQISQSLNRIVGSVMGLNRNVYKWDLATLDGKLFGASGYDMSPTMPFLTPDFFAKQNPSGRAEFFGPYNLKERVELPVFIVCKPVLDIETRHKLGYLLFLVKESSLSSLFRNNLPDGERVSFYIIDQKGDIVSATDPGSLSRNFFSSGQLSSAQWITLQEQHSVTAKMGGQDVLFALASSGSRNVDWAVISCVPMDYVMRGQGTINQVIVIVALLVGLASLLVSFFVSRSISRPIQSLSETIQEAAKGDMDLVISTQGAGDVEILYSGFNNLLDTAKHLMQRIYKEEEEKNEYQFRLLQSQIKPHFLYNALQTIKALTDLGLNEKASEVTSALSSYYRLSLSKGREIISAQEEMDLSLQYLYIQKMRYAGSLEYRFEVPDDLDACLLPKMTLQPVLENAIYHGIKEKEGMGTVWVSVQQQEEYLLFMVRDNGVGMAPMRLEAIQKALQADVRQPEGTSSDPSFGLASVQRRLQLLAGGSSGLRIQSLEGEYTEVEVKVKKIRQYPEESWMLTEEGAEQ